MRPSSSIHAADGTFTHPNRVLIACVSSMTHRNVGEALSNHAPATRSPWESWATLMISKSSRPRAL
jgi:hypothetical protein